MVGGGINKKDDGLPAISSTNIFSALESRRRKSSRKKLEDKDKAFSKSKDPKADIKEEKTVQFWAPSPVTVTSWADCEEDDDDYYATTAPPAAAWAPDQSSEAASAVKDGLSQGEESEEDEEDEEGDDDPDEEQEIESSAVVSGDTLAFKSTLPPVVTAREPERQLSKKELKKKELAELDAVLAELGLVQKDENEEASGMLPTVDEKSADVDVDAIEEVEGGVAPSESKSLKRRKAKREKSFKEGKEVDLPLGSDAEAVRIVDDGNSEEAEGNGLPADPKEVLKKLASLKKKKSMKEGDAAAKAAAAEASARASKLAAAKKREKNHYNQQPVSSSRR